VGETFEGYNCRVEVQDDALVLRRLGVASKVHGLSMEPERVPLDAITDVEMHAATRLRNGWLRIGLNGEPLQPVRRPYPYDPHTLLFLRRSHQEFQRLYELLVGVVEANRLRDPRAEPPPGSEVAEQLRKLGELHAAGVLSDAELEEKRRMLLRRR
jgi:hypothetical protein